MDERRRLDDGVVLEREGREREAPRRQSEQIHERGPRAVEALALLGPAERLEQERRVEDAAPLALRPVGIDQPDDLHLVELAVGRGGGVDDLHPAVAGPRRERLRAEPAADRRRGAGDVERRAGIEALVRAGQRLARAEHRRPHARLAIEERIGGVERPQVPADEGQHAAHQRAHRLRDRQGRDLGRGGRSRAGRRQGPAGVFVAAAIGQRGPGLDQRGQPLGVAQVARVGQRPVERGDGGALRHHAVGVGEPEVRRSQQGDRRRPGEAAGDPFEDQVERRRERLGRQRQRVAGVVTDAGAAEHVARQVEVRQRPAHDQGHARSLVDPAGPPLGLEAPGERRQLLLAIAAGEHPRVGRRHQADRALVAGVGHAQLLEAGQQVGEAFEPAAAEAGLGRHHVEVREPGQPGEQIEIGRATARPDRRCDP